MAKVTFEAFAQYIELERLSAGNDARLQAALDAADQAIDQWCARRIEVADANPSTRQYRPAPAARVLPIHDCVAITSVTDDGTTLAANTDYVADPLNGLTWAGESVPYSALLRIGTYWTTDDLLPTVSISARWGWASIPAPVVEATKMLAKDIALARELRGDVAGFGEFGMVRLRQSPQITGLLAPYRRAESWGIA